MHAHFIHMIHDLTLFLKLSSNTRNLSDRSFIRGHPKWASGRLSLLFSIPVPCPEDFLSPPSVCQHPRAQPPAPPEGRPTTPPDAPLYSTWKQIHHQYWAHQTKTPGSWNNRMCQRCPAAKEEGTKTFLCHLYFSSLRMNLSEFRWSALVFHPRSFHSLRSAQLINWAVTRW